METSQAVYFLQWKWAVPIVATIKQKKNNMREKRPLCLSYKKWEQSDKHYQSQGHLFVSSPSVCLCGSVRVGLRSKLRALTLEEHMENIQQSGNLRLNMGSIF